MKYKGIEVGIPSITQIKECIDSKGYNTSCSKLFDFCSASKWKIISERHIESVEQLVEKFGRKKGFGLKRKKKGEEHKNIKAQNKQAKYPEVKLPSKQTIANRLRSSMPTYYEQLRDARWYAFRRLVFACKGKRCAKCGSRQNLNIHHKSYRKGHYAWEYPISNMMVLCKDCHKALHGIH